MSTESGNVLIWNRITEQVLFKEEQKNVKQLTLIENSSKFIAVSRPNNPTGVENVRTTAILVIRSIPGRKILDNFVYISLNIFKKIIKTYCIRW